MRVKNSGENTISKMLPARGEASYTGRRAWASLSAMEQAWELSIQDDAAMLVLRFLELKERRRADPVRSTKEGSGAS